MRPVRYTIVVRGRLSERFASAFPGTAARSGRDQTRIDTEPLDLSQFYGLLEHLRNLAVELVSVNESGPTVGDVGYVDAMSEKPEPHEPANPANGEIMSNTENQQSRKRESSCES